MAYTEQVVVAGLPSMRNIVFKVILLGSFLYWGTGAAGFIHEKLDHAGDVAVVPTSAQAKDAGQDHKAPAHDDHEDCPTCQTLKMMKMEPSAPPAQPVDSQPLVYIVQGMQPQLASNPLIAVIDARGPPLSLPF